MKNFSTALNEVLVARNEKAPSADLVTSINNAKSHAKALDQLFGTRAFDPIAKKLLSSLSIIDAKDNREDFIAVKVVVKIISAANAIAKGNPELVDPYSRVIINNLIKLQGLSNKSTLVALSRAISYTDDEQKAALIDRHRCSPGTAGTQASSTRMMLRNLDICEVLKSKRGDVMTLKVNDRTAAMIAMFTGKPVDMSEAPEVPVKKTAAPKKAAPAKAEQTDAPVKKTATKKAAADKPAPVKKTASKKAADKPAETATTVKKATASKKAPKAA